MTLEATAPSGIFSGRKYAPRYTGNSSLINPRGVNPPTPFDTFSLPKIGISLEEDIVTITLEDNATIPSLKKLNSTIDDLIQLLYLTENWRENSRPITQRVVEMTLSLLTVVLEYTSITPSIVPTSRGGIQVEWHQKGIDLEIEVLESGTFEYFFNGPEGDREGTIENDLSILKKFLKYLK
jgi:hypothetical protein